MGWDENGDVKVTSKDKEQIIKLEKIIRAGFLAEFLLYPEYIWPPKKNPDYKELSELEQEEEGIDWDIDWENCYVYHGDDYHHENCIQSLRIISSNLLGFILSVHKTPQRAIYDLLSRRGYAIEVASYIDYDIEGATMSWFTPKGDSLDEELNIAFKDCLESQDSEGEEVINFEKSEKNIGDNELLSAYPPIQEFYLRMVAWAKESGKQNPDDWIILEDPYKRDEW